MGVLSSKSSTHLQDGNKLQDFKKITNLISKVIMSFILIYSASNYISKTCFPNPKEPPIHYFHELID